MAGGKNPGLNDVTNRRREIAADIARLQAEDKELEIAERVLGLLAARDTFRDVVIVPQHQKSRLSTADYIEQVLKESAVPLISTESVQAAASIKAGRDIPLSTIAPTLSIMKRDKIVYREGNKVVHRDRASEAGISIPGVVDGNVVSRPTSSSEHHTSRGVEISASNPLYGGGDKEQ